MIGLATEAHAARRTSKTARAAAQNENTPESSSQRTTPPPITSIEQRRRPSPSKSTGSSYFATHDDIGYENEESAEQSGVPDQAPPPYSESTLEGHAGEKDEADWELDDAVEDEEDGKALDRHSSDPSSTFDPGPVPSSKEGRQHYVDKIVQAFLARHPVPPGSTVPTGHLPCPVIIPQRRPHDKKRGFVRAYAPVLQACDVDQDSFLAFLKAMHQSSKASPIFNVINIAAMAAGFAPSISAMIVSTVVQAAAMTAIEVQGNMRTNDFLTQLNDKYFRPRGLFCLIFKYKPEDDATHEAVDISSTILKSITPSTSRFQQTLANASRASGRTVGELEMPHAAPLIFPALDDLHAYDPPGTKKESMKRKGKFVANYFDKRAQAAYETENPNSVLVNANTQEHKFASRYADPNHPVNSGSPIALLTGGVINPKSRNQQEQGQQDSGLGGILAGRRSQRHQGDRSSGGLGGGPLGLVGSLASMAVAHSRSGSSTLNPSAPAAQYGSEPLAYRESRSNPAAPYGGSTPSLYADYETTHDDGRSTDYEHQNRASYPQQIETDPSNQARNLHPTHRNTRRPSRHPAHVSPGNQSPPSQSQKPGGLLKRVLNQVRPSLSLYPLLLSKPKQPNI